MPVRSKKTREPMTPTMATMNAESLTRYNQFSSINEPLGIPSQPSGRDTAPVSTTSTLRVNTAQCDEGSTEVFGELPEKGDGARDSFYIAGVGAAGRHELLGQVIHD